LGPPVAVVAVVDAVDGRALVVAGGLGAPALALSLVPALADGAVVGPVAELVPLSRLNRYNAVPPPPSTISASTATSPMTRPEPRLRFGARGGPHT
jgi:hypothetical protein